MDSFVNEKDYKLLENDRYTFFVLRRVIGGECKLLLTDHEKLIICYTGAPFPIWVWTPDGASQEEMERAYQIVREYGLLDGDYRFNLKYELAQYFIDRAEKDGKKLSITLNMFAYDCPNPVVPSETADGGIHRCRAEDIDEVVDFLDLFHNELRIDQKDRDGYYEDAQSFIDTGNMYLWKDKEGNSTASCMFTSDEDMASINVVFTRPEFRRKHYAENLVYQVTDIAKKAGYVPMLYTDADYIASNACYEKIGYVLRGKLCTIG